MDEISLKALGKINIALDVLGTREDGYHDIRTIMQSVRLYDRVELKKKKEPGVKLEANLFMIPMGEDNIAYRAAELMMEKFEITSGVVITIQKYIPMAAGMAGGSADAAAVIIGMNRLFALGLTDEQMREVGLSLGADVPFCLARGTALCEGVGEILTPLPPFPRAFVLVAKPTGVAISTKTIYEKLGFIDRHPDIDGIVASINEKDLKGIALKMENVLENVTSPMVPQIGEIKRTMNESGALGAMMTGSGPAVFGIFDEEKNIQAAYDALKASGMALELYSTEIYQPEDERRSHQRRRPHAHRGGHRRGSSPKPNKN